MYKILLPIALLLSGCSYFTFNATMCDQIASEPGSIMPKECQEYSEEKADKAFHKDTPKHESKEDIIKFSQDVEENHR
ncbi:hypothetical protein GJV85_00140 [Sulfurimonas aquatica]|uniref:Lipoprotein n=1 Tax=Sulfurimonas aquatica TaxID=2672570 RepID=A0A975AXV3_9BACT|nr:hypothetical protein [Sulfurimonas aquatica]QSZ40591.1 hypothetical protein GJV85_00140 [Sulfurimonas aquatica]